MDASINVLGGVLQPCSTKPMTGFFRNGCCDTGPEDRGSHTVCVILTDEFLAMSRYLGNDLTTPRPEYGFSGLKAGQRWCLCASRFAGGAGIRRADCGAGIHAQTRVGDRAAGAVEAPCRDRCGLGRRS